MDFETHRIRSDEWRQYRELRLEALKDSPMAFTEQYDESLVAPDDFWTARVRRAASGTAACMFVATHDGRFVAKASCFVEPDITDQVSAHVVGVYTTPLWRGRGASEAVVMSAVGWARDDVSADRIRLFVTDINERAAAFYRRLGFVATGYSEPYPPDPTHVEFEMRYPRSTAGSST